jgi:predicted nuclease of predicted toxin-antitoxin system
MSVRPRLLLDQGLPRDAAEALRNSNVDCTHVGELGMAVASDLEILAVARARDAAIVTLDADFHAFLAVTGAAGPSVIRIRMQGLNGPAIASVVRDVLGKYAAEIAGGSMITVKAKKTTCHLLKSRD